MELLRDADARHRMVEVAIPLVAEGRYPEVVVANLPGAVSIATDLAADADERGVQGDACGTPAAQRRSLKVHRR